jgi:protein KTI12
MALITISGFPCSGKSTRASQLKDAFEEQLVNPSYNGSVKKVVLISDDSLNLTRQAYDGKCLSSLAPLDNLIIARV